MERSGSVGYRSTAIRTGYRITGSVRLPRDGYRSRMTDYLNAFERGFLAMTDVEISSLEGSGPDERRDFVAAADAPQAGGGAG